jgi:hypothetical protein
MSVFVGGCLVERAERNISIINSELTMMEAEDGDLEKVILGKGTSMG